MSMCTQCRTSQVKQQFIKLRAIGVGHKGGPISEQFFEDGGCLLRHQRQAATAPRWQHGAVHYAISFFRSTCGFHAALVPAWLGSQPSLRDTIRVRLRSPRAMSEAQSSEECWRNYVFRGRVVDRREQTRPRSVIDVSLPGSPPGYVAAKNGARARLLSTSAEVRAVWNRSIRPRARRGRSSGPPRASTPRLYASISRRTFSLRASRQKRSTYWALERCVRSERFTCPFFRTR